MKTEADKKTAYRSRKGRTWLLAIASVVLGISIYSWNAGQILGNQLPMPFGCGLAVVLSGSMEPTLYTDDLVVIRESSAYEVGDVVVYQSGNELIIHRIIELGEDTVTTQGDANSVADQPVSRSRIRGKMALRIPRIGAVVQILKRPVVVAVILLAAFLLAELSWRKEKDRKQEELDELREEIKSLVEELKKD